MLIIFFVSDQVRDFGLANHHSHDLTKCYKIFTRLYRDANYYNIYIATCSLIILIG